MVGKLHSFPDETKASDIKAQLKILVQYNPKPDLTSIKAHISIKIQEMNRNNCTYDRQKNGNTVCGKTKILSCIKVHRVVKHDGLVIILG